MTTAELWKRWGALGDYGNRKCSGCGTVTIVRKKPRGRRWLCAVCFERGER